MPTAIWLRLQLGSGSCAARSSPAATTPRRPLRRPAALRLLRLQRPALWVASIGGSSSDTTATATAAHGSDSLPPGCVLRHLRGLRLRLWLHRLHGLASRQHRALPRLRAPVRRRARFQRSRCRPRLRLKLIASGIDGLWLHVPSSGCCGDILPGTWRAASLPPAPAPPPTPSRSRPPTSAASCSASSPRSGSPSSPSPPPSSCSASPAPAAGSLLRCCAPVAATCGGWHRVLASPASLGSGSAPSGSWLPRCRSPRPTAHHVHVRRADHQRDQLRLRLPRHRHRHLRALHPRLRPPAAHRGRFVPGRFMPTALLAASTGRRLSSTSWARSPVAQDAG